MFDWSSTSDNYWNDAAVDMYLMKAGRADITKPCTGHWLIEPGRTVQTHATPFTWLEVYIMIIGLYHFIIKMIPELKQNMGEAQ